MVFTAFLLGFFSSAHCIGMCGPIALALPQLPAGGKWLMFRTALYYNLGRILSYTLIGLIFGLIGSSIALMGMQQIFALLIGTVLLLIGVFSLNLENLLAKIPIFRHFYTWVQVNIQNQFRSSGPFSYFKIGILNGFLPCGVVYLALAGTLVLDQLLAGPVFMLFFGLGTLPLMLSLTLFGHLMTFRVKRLFAKSTPYLFIGFALFILLRGTLTTGSF